jgi:ribosomal protein L7/L12
MIAGLSEGLAYLTSPTFAVLKRLYAALTIISDDGRDQALATVAKDAAAVKANGVVKRALTGMRNQTLRDETACACALTLAKLVSAASAMQIAIMIQDKTRRETVLKQVALEKEPERQYQHTSDVKAEAQSSTHTAAQVQCLAVSSDQRQALDAEADQLDRLVLPFLPEDKSAAIKAYRERTGASPAEAKEAVEAIARKHGLPLSPSSLLNSPSTCGMLLCVLGIGASFIPAVTRHLDPHTLAYERLAPGQPAGNQRWVPVPDTGLLSWEWASIPATFLVLGLVLIGAHSVRRLAILRAFAMLLAGTVVLVLDVVRVRPVHGSAESYTTPYVGCYIVGALAVGFLILGAMALRFAQMKTSGDADAQAMGFLGQKLHSLWESALSLCVGSRVKGASSDLTGDNLNDAPLSGAALEGEQPVSHDAYLPAMTPESGPVGDSPLMPGTPTTNAPLALPPEQLPGSGRSTMKVVIIAFFLIILACCLILFLSQGTQEVTLPPK